MTNAGNPNVGRHAIQAASAATHAALSTVDSGAKVVTSAGNVVSSAAGTAENMAGAVETASSAGRDVVKSAGVVAGEGGMAAETAATGVRGAVGLVSAPLRRFAYRTDRKALVRQKVMPVQADLNAQMKINEMKRNAELTDAKAAAQHERALAAAARAPSRWSLRKGGARRTRLLRRPIKRRRKLKRKRSIKRNNTKRRTTNQRKRYKTKRK